MGDALGPDGRYRGKKVLTEEEYQAQLETVIEKEYFPDLTRMREQIRLMDALDSGDIAEARRIKQQYAGLTPSRVCDTPLANAGDITADPAAVVIGGPDASAAAKRKDRTPTLKQFLARNVPEGDASFSMIAGREREIKQEMHARWFGKPGALRIVGPPGVAQVQAGAPQLAIADKEDGAGSGSGGAARNTEGALVTQAGPGGGSMPPPLAVMDRAAVAAAAAEHAEMAKRRLEFAKHLHAQKAKEERQAARDASSAPPTPKSRWGKRRRPEDEPPPPPDAQIGGGGAKDNYELLATPVITPGGGESPFVTWGMVDGTPLVLHVDEDDAAAAEPSAYQPLPLTPRDVARQKLMKQTPAHATAPRATPTEKLLKAAGVTPTTKAGGITPNLLRAITPKRGTGIFAKAAKGSTPRRQAAPPTPMRDAAHAAKRRKTHAGDAPRGGGSITDDLLNI